MDIFSLGCIIAEVYRNGRPLFDLPRLMEYKKGELIIDKDYFSQETEIDEFIIKMILSMISLEPKNRKTIDQYLHLLVTESIDSTSDSFPESFHKIFYPLGCAFLQPEFLFGDEKIALIYETTSKLLLINFRMEIK